MESNENVLSVVSGQTLMELTLPPQDYVIRGLLPMGLSIIGGAPKIGKSWPSSAADAPSRSLPVLFPLLFLQFCCSYGL